MNTFSQFLFIILAAFALGSCTNDETTIDTNDSETPDQEETINIAEEIRKELTENTTRVEIVYYVEGTTDTLYKSSSNMKDELATYVGGITDEPSELMKCGYTGKIRYHRFMEETVFDGWEFNVQEDCAHIVGMYNGELVAFKLSEGFIELTRTSYESYTELLNELPIGE